MATISITRSKKGDKSFVKKRSAYARIVIPHFVTIQFLYASIEDYINLVTELSMFVYALSDQGVDTSAHKTADAAVKEISKKVFEFNKLKMDYAGLQEAYNDLKKEHDIALLLQHASDEKLADLSETVRILSLKLDLG